MWAKLAVAEDHLTELRMSMRGDSGIKKGIA